MRVSKSAWVFVLTSSTAFTHAFTTPNSISTPSRLAATIERDETATLSPASFQDVQKLTYRDLQRHCKSVGLEAVGSTAVLRTRLLGHYGLSRGESKVQDATSQEVEELCATEGITICDEAEFKSLLAQVVAKASIGHWKTATRKLKQLDKRKSAENPVPIEAYETVLEACAIDRLNGARASEPARKILEDMSERGYAIPEDLANSCVKNSLGDGPGATHDDCGGIDVALAMVAAIESSPGGDKILTDETYGKLTTALAKDGAVNEAIGMLRTMVVEKYFSPSLSVFADVAKAATLSDKDDTQQGEDALQVLTFIKASGYELDSIAAIEPGRDILASGVIAAEKMDNLALGLRLLTAANKADGCAPDSGDALVATSSSAAQRACTLIHKRAITKACEDSNWKLAVKLLELMPKRGLMPATSVWRNVLQTCCKNEKSKKATAILLDWISLANEGKAETPPVSVFNTVVNTCEICGEEELTVKVLDVMKKTLDTEGNMVTFNIALKRLAKLGNVIGCEGILIGMLKEGLEPNVVSYTTTIGACAKEGMKNPSAATMWLQRMRVRKVKPNFHTYNTALAACLDGKLESTFIASKIATEMLEDAEKEIACGIQGSARFKSALPDSYTKVLARQLMKQLRDNWRSGEIDMTLAKTTTRVPLLKLVDFDKTVVAAQESLKNIQCDIPEESEDEIKENEEQDLEFNLLKDIHKDDHRTAMV